jgi:glycine/D-amino acid oxidase-like deaminating enzyme
MTTDYRSYSFWLENPGDDLTPRDPLDGTTVVDVAILGAGFTGLWTAYYLLQKQPALKIAVVEKEIAGFGPSGRNGGWCSGSFPVTPGMLRERYGAEAARSLLLAMYEAVDEVGRVAATEGIDAHFVKGGSLRLARGAHQLPSIQSSYETMVKLGLGDHYWLLDAAQVAERVRVAGALGAIATPECASLHPARLVRGLARAVEVHGGTIYEQTEVIDFVTGSAPRLITRRGDVHARTIVLAGESYLTRLTKLHRQLIPVYSLMIASEPLTDGQWAEIGWQDRACIGSSRLSVDYLSRTADGRILFGGRGAPYRFGSRIDDAFDRYPPTHAELRRMFVEWFPSLANIRFTHAWGGPLGMPRDWMPTMSFDPALGLATARGYTGTGVATANLSGRVLSDLILGVDSPLTHLPPVGHYSPDWEPEPLRWIGVRYVQQGFHRLDEQGQRTGRAPTGRSLVEKLGRH